MTAEQRVERARNAANARASVDGLIRALARKTLTDEQRARLAELVLTHSTDTEGGAL